MRAVGQKFQKNITLHIRRSGIHLINRRLLSNWTQKKGIQGLVSYNLKLTPGEHFWMITSWICHSVFKHPLWICANQTFKKKSLPASLHLQTKKTAIWHCQVRQLHSTYFQCSGGHMCQARGLCADGILSLLLLAALGVRRHFFIEMRTWRLREGKRQGQAHTGKTVCKRLRLKPASGWFSSQPRLFPSISTENFQRNALHTVGSSFPKASLYFW